MGTEQAQIPCGSAQVCTMIYLQPITFWAIVRDLPGTHTSEIAEHPDGAAKAYAERSQANEALTKMERPQDWQVSEILLVPPPMTAAAKRQAVKEEIEQSMGIRRNA